MGDVALVTGASRGIGLELCRQLLERNYEVLACPRVEGSAGLEQLAARHAGRLHRITLDVTDAASIAAAAEQAQRRVPGIDLLFNNAGVYPKDEGPLEDLDPRKLIDAFDVNTVGPLRVVQAFLPLLRRGRGKRILQITSLMGSIADNTSGGSYAYRISKTAVNMLTRNLAHDLGPEGFVVLALHPGWVQTRMGGPQAPLALADATAEVLETALGAGPADNGGFRGAGGKTLPF